MSTNAVSRGNWSSSFGFVLAAAGSAIGLGNIWRFPYMASEGGGGVFVLVYLICVLGIGVPVLFAELAIQATMKTRIVKPQLTLCGGRETYSV